jgi:hypothetical protein
MKDSGKHIHVIAFDVPYPADYGGVIDIFYKIIALHSIGFKVHLHCFQYGRPEAKELKKYCFSVNYYKRKTFRNPITGELPYIIASRSSNTLLENLLKDHYPILFEGLHSTFHLPDPRLQNRFKVVRTHNVEHDYYGHLEKVERNYFKKYFFSKEAAKLKKYQHLLKHADLIAAISKRDARYFSRKFDRVIHLPPFHGNAEVMSQTERGDYILYHGNLGVPENNEAALFLVNNIFSKLDIPCVVAGNNPSQELVHAIAAFKHVRLVRKTEVGTLNKLIFNAHINVLHTFQGTGIKLKLINALYMGRHCVANKEMIKDTGVESLCLQADTSEAYLEAIGKLWELPFEKSMIARRERVLEQLFGDKVHALRLDKHVPALVSETAFPLKEGARTELESSTALKAFLNLFSL